MICVKVLSDNTLQYENLTNGEECHYLQLVSNEDLLHPEDALTLDDISLLFSAAIGLYAISFVINAVLRQLGYR